MLVAVVLVQFVYSVVVLVHYHHLFVVDFLEELADLLVVD